MNKKKKEEKTNNGSGVASTLLMAGGAAAIGFLARDLWNMWSESQQEGAHSTTGRTRPPPYSGSTGWENQKDDLKSRKKNRTNVHDEDIPDCIKCVVCLDNPREIIIIPCGHVCLCEDCAEKVIKKCPICNQSIQNKKVAYVS